MHTLKQNQTGKAHSKRGKLTIEDIFDDERLTKIWRDKVANRPVEETADELHIHRNSITHNRKRIQAAIDTDPEIKRKLRARMLHLFPAFLNAVTAGLERGDASITNGLGRGLGIYRSEDSMEVTTMSAEEIQKRRLAQMAMAYEKVPTVKERETAKAGTKIT